MITLITGLTGSGKTWFMTQLLKKEWETGVKVYVNYPVFFPNENEGISRFWTLPDLYRLQNVVIGLDEAQKLFDARRWASMPQNFADLIAQHRHSFLDIITTTQDIGHIDLRVRSNVHELYHCQNIFRFPRDDREKPFLQLIKIIKKKRVIDSNDRLRWEVCDRPRFFLISKLWTKKLYDTYSRLRLPKYVTRTKYQKKKWVTRIYNRELITGGRARL